MSQNSKHDLGQVLGQILGREKCLLNCPPVFGTYGVRIGPKLLFNLGGLTQGVVGILFGSLDFVQNTAGSFSILQSCNKILNQRMGLQHSSASPTRSA